MQVNNTNSTSSNISGHGGKGCSQNGGCGGCGNDNKSTTNPKASAKSTISQHDCQYQVNTAQQSNTGHIPKVLWEQLPHLLKVLFLAHNVILDSKLIGLRYRMVVRHCPMYMIFG